MGIYSTFVFPRLCDLLLDNPFIARQRQAVLAPAHGDILEIGFGTGLNLAHYPPQVRRIATVDPNPGTQRLAQRRIRQARCPIEHHVLRGEQLPFPDHGFDCAVSTFTLCSIPQVERALAEVYRVLKPGGRFLFLEHGLSPEPAVQKWQRRLNWLQKRLGDGCQLDRNIRSLVAAAPFATLDIQEFYQEKAPRTHGYLYRGCALR